MREVAAQGAGDFRGACLARRAGRKNTDARDMAAQKAGPLSGDTCERVPAELPAVHRILSPEDRKRLERCLYFHQPHIFAAKRKWRFCNGSQRQNSGSAQKL